LTGLEIRKIAKELPNNAGLSSECISFINAFKNTGGPSTPIPLPDGLLSEDIDIIQKILGISIM
jgi:hypothetical protein